VQCSHMYDLYILSEGILYMSKPHIYASSSRKATSASDNYIYYTFYNYYIMYRVYHTIYVLNIFDFSNNDI
jgi:hypothetical protein